MKKILSLVLTVSSILFAVSANAAKIEPYTDEVMGCTLLLTGEIAKGDVEMFEALVAPFEGGRICLNSPGGSLSEAVKLADAIRGTLYFGTAIAEGHACESACAIVFMSGGLAMEEGQSTLIPIMHPKSKLGFHAPKIEFSDGDYNASQMNKSWNTALWSVAQIIKMRSGGYIFPENLFFEMLVTPPDSMFYVDTVGAASRFGIYVYPVGINSTSTTGALLNICLHVEDIDRESVGRFLEQATPYIRRPTDDLLEAFFDSGFQVEASSPCKILLNKTEMKIEDSAPPINHITGRPICVSFDPTLTNSMFRADCESGAFPYMSYPPNILLSDLPNDIDKSWREFLAKTPTTPIDAGRQENRQCLLGSDISRIINVEEYVNLRDQPNFEASILRQIPLGETVFIPSGGGVKAMGSEAGVKECASACKEFSNNSESSSARDRVNKCINDNAIWYEITDERGNSGWVSRKYLSDEESKLATPPPKVTSIAPLQ